MPQFRASCPTGILAAGGGGTIFINGKQAQVKETGANALPRDPVAFNSTSFSRGGKPSLSYTALGGANGMCTVTKFRPTSAPAAGSQHSGGMATGKMASECKGFAAEKYKVRPSYVQVHPTFRDHGMYSMYGNAGGKSFICTFAGNGKFVAVDSTGNPDGDL